MKDQPSSVSQTLFHLQPQNPSATFPLFLRALCVQGSCCCFRSSFCHPRRNLLLPLLFAVNYSLLTAPLRLQHEPKVSFPAMKLSPHLPVEGRQKDQAPARDARPQGETPHVLSLSSRQPLHRPCRRMRHDSRHLRGRYMVRYPQSRNPEPRTPRRHRQGRGHPSHSRRVSDPPRPPFK